jgi:putative ABC transport system permease protein
MTPLATLFLSLRLLAEHRVRTLLSVSGLLVGVAVVTVMVAVGRGAQERVLDQIRALGTDLLLVNAAPAPRVAGRERQADVVTLLRPADALAIAEGSDRVRRAAPQVARSVTVQVDGRTVPTSLAGTTPEGLEMRGIQAARGRVFDHLEDRQRARVVLLGPTAARNLFGDADPVGREVRIGRDPFEVIGVARSRGVDPGGGDLDDVVLVPLETAMRRVLNIPYVHTLVVQARNSGDLDALEAEVREILAQRHRLRAGASEPWRILNQATLLRTEQAAARSLSGLVVSVAGLAFVVGGIGILSVMLMSVRERMREIGLRRAVGARGRDILLQFVLEAGIVAGVGGAAGLLAGVVVASGAAALGPWDLKISWTAAALTFAASGVVGVVAGLVPARRAAGITPIEALRSR